MNPDLALLHSYPFEKLAQLFKGLTPPSHLKAVGLSIGEPKHPSLVLSLTLLTNKPNI